MKKSLIASAACLACSGVWAQVSLYGIADAGITHVTGATGGTKTKLSSGIMDGSRWGLKVEEDMGGGFKTLVTLESRFEMDNGSVSNRPASGSQLPDRLTAGLPPSVAAGVGGALGPTLGVNLDSRLFDRQAWMGLVTPVGGFLMGRQYTPAFEALATFDSMGTQSSLAAGQLAGIPSGLDIRYDKTLQYRIIKGPWNAALMTSFPGGATSSSQRLMGLNAIYKGQAFQAGFGYNTKKNSADQKALSSTVVGASTLVGAFKVSGLWARIQEPNPSSGPELAVGLAAAGVPATLVSNVIDRLKQDANLLHLGVRYEMGAAGHVTVAINRFDDKRAANADVTTYGVAYTYPLSKRTNLNMVLTRYNNSANAQAAPGGNGYLGGVTATAGRDATSLALGIRHAF
jgi:predicted porin